MQKKISKTNINSPSIFTIFGITGDLARKKIIPALWHLFEHNRLPKHIAIIGFALDNLSNKDLKNLIKNSLKNHCDSKTSKKYFDSFFKLFYYNQGDFKDKKPFENLLENIKDIDEKWAVCSNKLFYLAVPPITFKDIFKNLASVKLNIPCGGELGWSRILIEKPFGVDSNSSKKLQTLLSKYFKEEQIYRIDHYLFKEIIEGIRSFRFSNNLFEKTWNNSTIERIDIKLLESIGVENRGNFYDSIGTLRDVGQNHFLSILSSITREPIDFDVLTIRENRASVLGSLKKWTNKTLKENTFRAQYKNYKKIKGVKSNSKTETYFSLKTEIVNFRWKGVPIYMEAGKRTGEVKKEITLTLKHPNICYLCEEEEYKHHNNRIVFRLEPNDEVAIYFWSKKPGFEEAIEERIFSFFLYKKETKVEYIEEYSKILYTAMKGDQTFFISSDEVKNSWKFIDPIINAWKNNNISLEEYEVGKLPNSINNNLNK